MTQWNVRLHRPGRGSIHLGTVDGPDESLARLHAISSFGASEEEIAEYRAVGRHEKAERCIREDSDFDVTRA